MSSVRQLLTFLLLASSLPASAAKDAPSEWQVLEVERLTKAPVLDSRLDEWGESGWHDVMVRPAIEKDDKNRTGQTMVRMKVGLAGDRFYLAARWADASADQEYKPWIWRGNRYQRGKQNDDMFAVRFHLAGDYDKCMITDRSYQVDTWLWSAGRSNPAGYADDLRQVISTELQENAAEYTGSDGNKIYIRKLRDEGVAPFRNRSIDRKQFAGKMQPSVEVVEEPSGSVADVMARGEWRDGYWNLEMSRKLDTGHDDDVVFAPGSSRIGAIGVFNKTSHEHKSVSGTLEFRFPK